MYNFTLAASAHCQQGKLGMTLETTNNAEPLQDRQHAILTLHRRRSASHFGTCDSRPAISQETHSRGETPVEIPRHGPSFQIWGFCAHHSPPTRVKCGTLDKVHDIIFRAKFCSGRYVVSYEHALSTQS